MWRDRLPRGSRVRESQDKPDLPPEPLRERNALELRCSQLRLQVAKASLNLHKDNLGCAGEHHVCRSAIGRSCDGVLETDTPGRMRGGPNQFGQFELS